MKKLVYGAGVTGCELAHVLKKDGNDVTLLARGDWKDTLEKQGLVIRHYLQRKTTTDIIKVTDGPKRKLWSAIIYVMCKTPLGRLAATDNCAHAVSEMTMLDRAWEKLHAQKPDIALHVWDSLRKSMPVYETMPEADITCLDYSPDMMERAKRQAEKRQIRNVRFMQGDVGKLPFEDESFDLVMSLNGFHAFPDKEAAYSEIFRVQKPGGPLLAVKKS